MVGLTELTDRDEMILTSNSWQPQHALRSPLKFTMYQGEADWPAWPQAVLQKAAHTWSDDLSIASDRHTSCTLKGLSQCQ